MATLIPSVGTSAFDSTGARRLAERLERKLDDAYIPLPRQMNLGREGQESIIIKLPDLNNEVFSKIDNP